MTPICRPNKPPDSSEIERGQFKLINEQSPAARGAMKKRNERVELKAPTTQTANEEKSMKSAVLPATTQSRDSSR